MSIINRILSQAYKEKLINLGPGLPDPSTFPLKDIKQIFDELEPDELNYTSYTGREDLKQVLNGFLESLGVENRELIITSGAQEAIALISIYMKNRGMGVRVGNPVYLEALNTFRQIGVSVSPSDVDREGELPDVSDAYYIIPDGHNPTGVSMSEERRELFAQLSKDVLIIEDSTYSLLSYERRYPPVSSLTENSVFILSFSKIIAPGLRIAVMAVPEYIYTDLEKLRSSINICAPSLSQAVLLRLVERGLEDHIRRAANSYRKKRDALYKHLKDYAYVKPNSGFFIWLHTPVDGEQLLEKSYENGVVFIPGRYFYTIKPENNTARLSFSYETEERLEKVGEVLKELLDNV